MGKEGGGVYTGLVTDFGGTLTYLEAFEGRGCFVSSPG